MNAPRILIAAPHSGAGKTSVSAGLMAAFKNKGLVVQPYKVGPDYIDPAFHAFVCGRKSRNLDPWMTGEDNVRELFARAAPGPEGLSVVEGVMGLFDGLGTEHVGSSAHVAEILRAPIVLVVNGEGVSRSLAATISGFNNFWPGLKLAGVIINKLSGATHYELLRKAVEEQAGVRCFGWLPKNKNFALESRHLGLVPSVEVADLGERLAALSEAVAETVDLKGLLELARSAPDTPAPKAAPKPDGGKKIRLGLALDSAFNFYYEDNLRLLKELGAEIIPFSPRADAAPPPDLDGLYIGGGFPEIFAAELEANVAMRSALRGLLEAGLPCYAECGGLMYLSRAITGLDGRRHEMLGFFDVETEMTRRLQNFGYVELTLETDAALGPAGTKTRAHEFHHSRIIEDGAAPDYVMDIVKPDGRAWRGGLVRRNTLAAYPHLHFYGNIKLAENFIKLCQEKRMP